MCDGCVKATVVTTERRLEALDASDAIIIKLASVGKVAQIARIEVKLRDLAFKKWEQRQLQAVKTATTLFKQGKTAKQITSAIDKIMRKWADDVLRRFLTDIKAVYFLAREAAWDKATGKTKGSLQYDTDNITAHVGVKKVASVPTGVGAVFDLVDDNAVAAIQTEQMFWIGEHYDTNVSQSIREVTNDTVLGAGSARAAAGKTLERRVKDTLSHVKTPGGFNGSSSQYFEGLVANAVTNARVQGQIRSLHDLGVTRYEIVNPSDRRTCPVCAHMNGKVFTITHGVEQMEADLEAKNPEDVKATHPWHSPKEIKAISPTAGPVAGKAGDKDANALAAKGAALPPFHFRCRCTVDISDEIGSFSPLPASAPPIPPPTAPPQFKDTTKWANSLSKKQIAAFEEWTGEGSSAIRMVDAGDAAKVWSKGAAAEAAEELALMREALATAPNFKGTAFRGMHLDSKQAKAMARTGGTIEQNALSSWSKSVEITRNFSQPEDFDNLVVFAHLKGKKLMFVEMKAKISKNRSAVSLAHEKLTLYPEELEVLVEKGVKFRVTESIPVDLAGKKVAEGSAKHAGYHISMEEI